MELHFQPQARQQSHRNVLPAASKPSKSKARNRSSNNSKFVGVRQRPSGRWVAEIKDTTQKIRMWLGTFETAEEAARAYDEAACLLRGSNTRTNFVTHVSPDSALASKIRNLLNLKKQNKVVKTTRSPAAPHSTSSGGSVSSNNSSAANDTRFNITASTTDVWNVERKLQDVQTAPEQACRPRLGEGELELPGGNWTTWSPSDKISPFFDHCLEAANDIVGHVVDVGVHEMADEFERMKVERQISASLYTMNGVQEYLEMVAHDPSDTLLWDLPPICHFSCHT